MAFGLGDRSKNSQSGNGSADSLALDNPVAQRRESLEDQIVHAFEQWRDAIYRYLVVAGGNPAEAEEIAQECFVRLFQTLHAGKPVEHTQRWLFRVAHNLLIDHARRTQPRSASASEVAHVIEDRREPAAKPRTTFCCRTNAWLRCITRYVVSPLCSAIASTFAPKVFDTAKLQRSSESAWTPWQMLCGAA